MRFLLLLLAFVLASINTAQANAPVIDTDYDTMSYAPAETGFDESELILAERLATYMATGQGALARKLAKRSRTVYRADGSPEPVRSLNINLDGRVGSSPPMWQIIRDNAAYYRSNPEQLLRHMRAPRRYFKEYTNTAKYQSAGPGQLGLKPIYQLPKSKTGTYSSYLASNGQTIYVIDDQQFVQTRLPMGDVWVAYNSRAGPQRT